MFYINNISINLRWRQWWPSVRSRMFYGLHGDLVQQKLQQFVSEADVRADQKCGTWEELAQSAVSQTSTVDCISTEEAERSRGNACINGDEG
jgi:hypothetical protein